MAEGGADRWQAAQDEGGNTYYYNQATGETTWDAPPGFQQAPMPAAAASYQQQPAYGGGYDDQHNDGGYTESGMKRGPAPRATPSGVVGQKGGKAGGSAYNPTMVKEKTSCKRKLCYLCGCLCCLIVLGGAGAAAFFFASQATCDKMEECGTACWATQEVTIPASDAGAGIKLVNNWGNDFIGTAEDKEHKVYFKGDDDEWGIFVFNKATALEDTKPLMTAGPDPEDNVDDDGFVFVRRDDSSAVPGENKLFCRQASAYIKIPDTLTDPIKLDLKKESSVQQVDEGGDIWIGDLQGIDISDVTISVTRGTTTINNGFYASGDVSIVSTLVTDTDSMIETDGDFSATTTNGNIDIKGSVSAAGDFTLTTSELGSISTCQFTPTSAVQDCEIAAPKIVVAGGLGGVRLFSLHTTSTHPATPTATAVDISTDTGDIYVNRILTKGNIQITSRGRATANGGKIELTLAMCDDFHGLMTINAGESSTVSWTCPSVTFDQTKYWGHTCVPTTQVGPVSDVEIYCPGDTGNQNTDRRLTIDLKGDASVHIDFIIP
mmetsp:Transcript_8121/g.28886  ORF Transcript_8121/g.28886 Transcript_8121/m.28886 type:complete len:548 (-) Transcript_8121:323-1966(-)